MEKGYAANWADYIESQNMTMDEALEYIKESNSQKDRYAHQVVNNFNEYYPNNFWTVNEEKIYDGMRGKEYTMIPEKIKSFGGDLDG